MPSVAGQFVPDGRIGAVDCDAFYVFPGVGGEVGPGVAVHVAPEGGSDGD